MPRDDIGASFTIGGPPPELTSKNCDADGGKRPPQRELVIEAVQCSGATFWHDADSNAFVTVDRDGQKRRYRVRSRPFGLLVRILFGEANPVLGKHGSRPGSVSAATLKDAVDAFEAMAQAGELRRPEVRTTWHHSAIWLDLGDESWRLVCVAAEGWRMVDAVDIPLLRPSGMRALPQPTRIPEALKTFRELVNVACDDDFRLLVGWSLAALYPFGPYPVLAVDGEQGSAKTTLCRMLRRLTDPNKADLRAPPRCEDDLLIAAQNGRVVALDNMSFIEPWLADAICRLATGAGLGKRQLYSDGDEVLVAIARPVLLNGIPALLARGDLADRSAAITTPAIPDERRRPENEIWRDFEAARPGILAVLLDGLAAALRRLPSLKLTQLPRMADFARLVCAAAPALGWTEAEMLAAIERNREAATIIVIESDPLAAAVRSIASEAGPSGWTGTASDLLNVVNSRIPNEVQKEHSWPKDSTRFSGRLRRIAPALRKAGLNVVLPGTGGRSGRLIELRHLQKAPQRSERSDRPVAAGQRSEIPSSVPERGASQLKANGWNAGNARNAALHNPSAGADTGTLRTADASSRTLNGECEGEI